LIRTSSNESPGYNACWKIRWLLTDKGPENDEINYEDELVMVDVGRAVTYLKPKIEAGIAGGSKYSFTRIRIHSYSYSLVFVFTRIHSIIFVLNVHSD
jgi:hypothetical protein